MTAHSFIDQLFSRPGYGEASNVRRLTDDQIKLMLDLIGQDEEGGAVRRGQGRSIVWMPSGRWKYAVTEDPLKRGKNTVARIGNTVPSDAGRLF